MTSLGRRFASWALRLARVGAPADGTSPLGCAGCFSGARAVAVAIALCGLACGCGGLPSVTGTVQLGGQPLTTGNLVFHPVSKGTVGTAVISDDGTFTVM